LQLCLQHSYQRRDFISVQEEVNGMPAATNQIGLQVLHAENSTTANPSNIFSTKVITGSFGSGFNFKVGEAMSSHRISFSPLISSILEEGNMRPTTFTPILLILTAVHKKITLNQLPQGCFLTHRLYFCRVWQGSAIWTLRFSCRLLLRSRRQRVLL